jgi:hypothetical protein
MNDYPDRPEQLIGVAQAGQLIRPDAPDGLRHRIALRWAIVDDLDRRLPYRDTLQCPLCGHQGGAARPAAGHGSGQAQQLSASLSSFSTRVSYCIFGGGDLIRYACPSCDLIFGPEKMLALSEHALAEEYEWHYRAYREGDSTEQELRAFYALKPRRDGIYLNWGAGDWSRTLDVLRSEGWNAVGFEPHPSGAPARPGVMTDWRQISAMRFDGIFSNNVLEHLRYPLRELRVMAGLLAPGGRMSHATPCFAYRYEFTRFHIFFYLGRSQSLLAQKSGLSIVSHEADGDFINLVMGSGSA